MEKRYVVIMAGGKGERFWPQSRLKRPKHLLPIVGETSMLAQTLERLEGIVPGEHIFVITSIDQRDAILADCPDLSPERVIDEPMGRDTAAAVALALAVVKRKDPEAVFATLPADHVIHDIGEFKSVLEEAFRVAEATDGLVTIGVKPTGPATGYGYIQRGKPLEIKGTGHFVYAVERFVEKPDLATARRYVESKNYYWNAGMFVWKVKALCDAFEKHSPVHAALVKRLLEGLERGQTLASLLTQHYPALEKISIDYALMEKAEKVLTIEATFDWDDVGEWPAIARHFASDKEGNVVKGDAVLEDCAGNIVVTEGGHVTALIGLDNCIVVHTAEATLVCAKNKAQDIKRIVRRLSEDPKYRKLL